MKQLFVRLALVLSLFPALAFAGWGAIAYNSATGASSESHGYASYAEAVNTALNLCGPGCTIVNWEHDSCIALATGNGRWGEAHGFATANEAASQAIAYCGVGCTWQEWACN